jgi:ATP-dependent Clp protease ATP-binding subunit ClpC
MFERYLERARRVLFFSRYEASQLGHLSIEPPHLLLGILREGSAVVAAVLERSNLSAESARDEIVRLFGPTTAGVSSRVEIPFSADTKRRAWLRCPGSRSIACRQGSGSRYRFRSSAARGPPA